MTITNDLNLTHPFLPVLTDHCFWFQQNPILFFQIDSMPYSSSFFILKDSHPCQLQLNHSVEGEENHTHMKLRGPSQILLPLRHLSLFFPVDVFPLLIYSSCCLDIIICSLSKHSSWNFVRLHEDNFHYNKRPPASSSQ